MTGDGARRFRSLIGLILLVQSGLLAAAAAEPVPASYRAIENPETLNYLLHLPAGYETSGRRYPLLLFLHGIAQRGNGSARVLERVARDGPFRTMRDGGWDRDLPLIVVGPQSPGLMPWWQGEDLRRLLDHLAAAYRIDSARQYLTGISMGGRAVWWLADNFPNAFAALVPVSAWATDVADACDRFRGRGVWAFHGARDPLVGLSAGRRPIDDLGACLPALSPAPHITVLPDVGHGSWHRVFESGHGGRNTGADGETYADIYRWMLSFRSAAADRAE